MVLEPLNRHESDKRTGFASIPKILFNCSRLVFTRLTTTLVLAIAPP